MTLPGSRTDHGRRHADRALQSSLPNPAVDAAAAQVLAAYGRVDILINSAGVVTGKRFADLTEADVQRTFDVNVFALYRTARATASSDRVPACSP